MGPEEQTNLTKYLFAAGIFHWCSISIERNSRTMNRRRVSSMGLKKRFDDSFSPMVWRADSRTIFGGVDYFAMELLHGQFGPQFY